jgi:hypothetical protein
MLQLEKISKPEVEAFLKRVLELEKRLGSK